MAAGWSYSRIINAAVKATGVPRRCISDGECIAYFSPPTSSASLWKHLDLTLRMQLWLIHFLPGLQNFTSSQNNYTAILLQKCINIKKRSFPRRVIGFLCAGVLIFFVCLFYHFASVHHKTITVWWKYKLLPMIKLWKNGNSKKCSHIIHAASFSRASEVLQG